MKSKHAPIIDRLYARSIKLVIPALIAVFVISSCTSREPYQILTFQGKGTVFNSSKSNLWVSGKADSIHPYALLAEKGDLIFIEDNILYFKNIKDTLFTFGTQKPFGILNGKINSITISYADDMLPWFRQMTEEEVSDLQMIAFNDSFPATYLPYLTRIAKLQPGVGICGDISVVKGLVDIFNPEVLMLQEAKCADFKLFEKWGNIEVLYITLNDTLYNIPLPRWPRLKQLIISEISHKRKIATNFLANNTQIDHISLATNNSLDISFLQPLSHIKQLSICGYEDISGLSVIENHKHIESLCLVGGYVKGFSVINKLKGLRWLTIPVNTAQAEFNEMLASHPNLEVLEIIKNDTIKDLKPIQKLKKLTALTITDTLTDFNALTSMQQLKFLSLPAGAYDSGKLAVLKKALPNCTIVANEGFCLGSGWLLLIFPAILGFAFLLYRTKKSRI